MAEADGNRTRLVEMLDHVGFEDRGGHQAPRRLRDEPTRRNAAFKIALHDRTQAVTFSLHRVTGLKVKCQS